MWRNAGWRCGRSVPNSAHSLQTTSPMHPEVTHIVDPFTFLDIPHLIQWAAKALPSALTTWIQVSGFIMWTPTTHIRCSLTCEFRSWTFPDFEHTGLLWQWYMTLSRYVFTFSGCLSPVWKKIRFRILQDNRKYYLFLWRSSCLWTFQTTRIPVMCELQITSYIAELQKMPSLHMSRCSQTCPDFRTFSGYADFLIPRELIEFVFCY